MVNDEEVLAALEREFGYRPNEADGEKWCVFRDHALVVIHRDRRPRVYTRGNKGGDCYEIALRFE